jgi:hypothetical protein
MSQFANSSNQMQSGCFDPAVLNKQGVSWLVFGGFQEAVTFFKNALVTLKTRSLLQIPELRSPRVSPHLCPMYTSIGVPIQEERFYIYNRALVFTPSETSAVSEIDYPLYSAIILFNIALAHHLQAQGGPGDRALRDAGYFYSMCLQILASVETRCDKRIIAPVKLAALNNVAIIHYEHGDAVRAHSVLTETFALLTPATVGLDDETFDQNDFDGITLNAVMMRWTFSAACA